MNDGSERCSFQFFNISRIQHTIFIIMSTSNASSRSTPRAVTFSEYSELVVYPDDSKSDKSTKWYSSKDRNRFRQSVIDDARRVSQEIKDLPPGEVMTHNQLCQCLGIEVFLGSARCAEQARRSHIAAVLSEHYRQKHNGTYDIENLSGVSKRTSEWSTTRAWMLADRFAAIRMDENDDRGTDKQSLNSS